MKSKYLLLLTLIFLIGLFLRIFQLGEIPPGLTNDEVEKGYDAYSILKTGKDQWGEPYPLYSFKGFGDYRMPLSTYVLVPSIAIFDLTEIALRIPSVIFGMLMMALTYLLAKELFDKKIALISAFLLSISPWHIGMNRVGIETNLASFLLILTLYLCFLGLKKPKILLLAPITYLLGIFSYYSVAILLPLTIISFSLIYRKLIFVGKKIFPSILFIALLLLASFLIMSLSGSKRLNQISILQDSGVIDKINEKRGACQAKYPDLVCKFVFNKQTAYAATFTTNYLKHFSPDLLFISGSKTALSILPERSFFYLFELPLFISGLYFLIRKRDKPSLFLLAWLFLAPIPDSPTSDGHYARMFVFIPVIELIEAYGIVTLIRKTYNVISRRSVIILSLCIFIMIIIASVFNFFIGYLTFYPAFYSRSSQYGFKDVMHYVNASEVNYENIYISNKFYDTKLYIYYLFYNKYDPALYQMKNGVIFETEKNGWINVGKIGKVNFVYNLPEVRAMGGNNLLIGNDKEFPIDAKPIYTVVDLRGDIIFVAMTSDYLKEFENNQLINKR